MLVVQQEFRQYILLLTILLDDLSQELLIPLSSQLLFLKESLLLVIFHLETIPLYHNKQIKEKVLKVQINLKG